MQRLKPIAVLLWQFRIAGSGFEGKQYIFEEVKPKTYKMIPVKTGNSEHGFTEITGLTSAQTSKKWVTKGAYNLLMALKNVEDEEE